MVDECKPLEETAAGQELSRQIDKVRARYVQELKELQLETERAIVEKDQETAEALALMQIETQALLEATIREREYLSRIEVDRLLFEKDDAIARTKEAFDREKKRRELGVGRKDMQIQEREQIIEQTQLALKKSSNCSCKVGIWTP